MIKTRLIEEWEQKYKFLSVFGRHFEKKNKQDGGLFFGFERYLIRFLDIKIVYLDS